MYTFYFLKKVKNKKVIPKIEIRNKKSENKKWKRLCRSKKKSVLLLSTFHHSVEQVSVTKRKHLQVKPNLILDYNDNKGIEIHFWISYKLLKQKNMNIFICI